MSVPNIILERIPDYIEPVNKELWFETSSTASNVQDFKYVFKIEAKNEPFETNSYIQFSTLYKVPPRPSDGHGFFTPHPVLKALFQYYPSPFQQGFKSGFVGLNPGQNAGILDNYFEYRLKYGFEYNPNLTFTQTYNYLGQLALSFSVAPGFQAGDLIIIDKTNKFVNSYYDGTASILGSQSSTQWVTDVPYGTNVLNESGTIINLQRISATTSARYTFNGTRQYYELDKDYTKYICGFTATPGYFLTNWSPDRYKPVYRGLTSGLHEYQTISLISATPTQSAMVVEIFDIDDNLISSASVLLSNTQRYRRLDFGVGPQNLHDEFFPAFDFNDPTYDHYRVTLKKGVATQSQTYNFKLKDYCYKPVDGFINYELTTVVWLNRVGGWDYFSFIKDKKKTLTIQKNLWTQQVPIDYTYGSIYTRAQRGQATLNNFAQETFEVKSDWIDDYQSQWLEELYTSPEAYVIINGTYSGGDPNDYTQFTGRIAPINILNTSYEVQTTLRNKMYNITLQYRMSYPLNLQNQ